MRHDYDVSLRRGLAHHLLDERFVTGRHVRGSRNIASRLDGGCAHKLEDALDERRRALGLFDLLRRDAGLLRRPRDDFLVYESKAEPRGDIAADLFAARAERARNTDDLAIHLELPLPARRIIHRTDAG